MKHTHLASRKSRLAAAGLCVLMALGLSACGGQAPQQTEPPAQTETAAPTQTPEPTPEEIVLNNHYATQFGEKNAVTYPVFTFDYLDTWQVTEERVDAQTERVTLENDRGVQIIYAFYSYPKDYSFGGSSVSMARVEVTKAADSQFVPGYVQGTDHKSLGEFMVAKLKTTGQLNMQTDSEFIDVDGSTAYAVVPASYEGTREDVRGVNEAEFSFWYSAHVAFVCQSPDGEMTEQETCEALAVLSSFRVEE